MGQYSFVIQRQRTLLHLLEDIHGKIIDDKERQGKHLLVTIHVHAVYKFIVWLCSYS